MFSFSSNTFTLSSQNDIENLMNNLLIKVILNKLIINYNGEGITSDLVIDNFLRLEEIMVMENSLQDLNTLKISNNKELKTIEIGDYAFYDVKNVIIESIFKKILNI